MADNAAVQAAWQALLAALSNHVGPTGTKDSLGSSLLLLAAHEDMTHAVHALLARLVWAQEQLQAEPAAPQVGQGHTS